MFKCIFEIISCKKKKKGQKNSTEVEKEKEKFVIKYE